MEKEAVTSGKRKAESSEAPAALGCAELAGEVPAAADAMLAPAAGESFVEEATGIKYIEMPENYLCWILSMKRFDPGAPYDPRNSRTMSQEEIERELASMERLKASLAGVKEVLRPQIWAALALLTCRNLVLL